MILPTIWFFIWGLLWAVFFMTDGFDFGVGMLLPFLGKTEAEKQAMAHSIGPFWDGNEVWLITAGGATFAAFPTVYAVMFSSLYTPLMLILFSLILRGVSFEFRNKIGDPLWTNVWDAFIFIGSVVPSLLFGVAFANIFRGIPIDAQGIYHGTLFTLLNLYGIAGGLLFIILFLQHGSIWLALKTENELHDRVAKFSRIIWPILLVFALFFLVTSWQMTNLLQNYLEHPVLFIFLLLPVLALLMIRVFLQLKAYFKAWLASAVTILGTTFFAIIGLFPNMYPSSLDPNHSLTAYNSASSPLTLTIMLVVVLIFVPIVIAYQIWVYYLFKGKLKDSDLLEEAY